MVEQEMVRMGWQRLGEWGRSGRRALQLAVRSV